MITIEQAIKEMKPIKVINAPVAWTPNDLIRHYIDLYNVLDEAKKRSEAGLRTWLKEAQTRPLQDFTTQREAEILEELLK